MKIVYECGICGAMHPWEWDGDCRDDANRFDDVADAVEVRTWGERIAGDKMEMALPIKGGCCGCGSTCGMDGCKICVGETLCLKCDLATRGFDYQQRVKQDKLGKRGEIMTYQEALELLEAFMDGQGNLSEEWYDTALDALLDVVDSGILHEEPFLGEQEGFQR